MLLLSFLLLLLSPLESSALTASKTHWKIGVLQISPSFYLRWPPTFQTYLTNVVGTKFTPPLNFTVEPLGFTTTFSKVENSELDFIFTNPSAFSCLDSEFGVSAIVTLRNLRKGKELTEFGGVLFTRADNDAINNIPDIAGKIYEAVSISGFGASLMQAKEAKDLGFDIINEAAQVRFSFSQRKIVEDVYSGAADVGAVRTDMIDGFVAQGLYNMSDFKIINLKNETFRGESFPFAHSTQLYSEWCLAALPHTELDFDVANEVQAALLSINSSSTPATEGGYAGWQFPKSYMAIRGLQQDLEFIKLGDDNIWRCDRSSALYDAIQCPSGSFKKSIEDVESACGILAAADSKYTCPTGYECICKPCKIADKVEVLPGLTTDQNPAPCQKMGKCQVVQQNEPAHFQIKDNLKRNKALKFKLHVSSDHPEYEKEGVIQPVNNTYSLTLASSNKGDNVLELSIENNGTYEQIESSPILVRVNEKDCGSDKKANENGECKALIEIEYLPDWFRAISYTLFGINILLSIGFASWTFAYRRLPIIRASQPTFLYLVCLGCIISSTTILTVGIDEEQDLSAAALSTVCMASVWFYSIGFGLTVSALFAKTYRAKCLMIDKLNAKKSRYVMVSVIGYLKYVAIALTLEVIVSLSWTLASPLEWDRQCASDSQDDYCRSIGHCRSEDALTFGAVLLSLHFVFLCYMLWVCYLVRNIPAEFAEHKWITAATVSSLEILFLTPFLVWMTWEQPTTSTLIMTIAFFANDFGVLVMIFIPKISAMYQKHTLESENHEKVLFDMRKKVRTRVSRKSLGPSGMDEDSKYRPSLSMPRKSTQKGSVLVPTANETKLRKENENLKRELEKIRTSIGGLNGGALNGSTLRGASMAGNSLSPKDTFAGTTSTTGNDISKTRFLGVKEISKSDVYSQDMNSPNIAGTPSRRI
mmetsp:Transcript_23862/g.42288  ORF Transcript_23862/g.42288 Transcript_23862/m.42288 type:complete len:931 (-) Transcript_23862:188-2980(-)